MSSIEISQMFVLMLGLYTLSGIGALVSGKGWGASSYICNILTMTASAAGVFLALKHLAAGYEPVLLGDLTSTVPYISWSLTIDKLSAFFILALSLLTFSVTLYSMGYISHYGGKRNVGLFYFLFNLFILSMILVITARNLVFFLVAWEVMSILSYFLVIFESEDPQNRRAGLIYLIMTHLATAFLIIAFMLIYKYTGTLELGIGGQSIPTQVKNYIFILLLVGFGTKAGIIPLHVWLPYAHPAAPSNVSALMSGIMIKTAVYGLIRFVLVFLGEQPVWWGVVILVIGTLCTLLGVAYALLEQNVKRLLAYCSIENIGVILIGVGIAFSAYAQGQKALSGLALMAALFHLLNHTLFKGALFLGAGSIHYATHTKDLEQLGGLMKKMPWTGLYFLLASLSISAIPPFNGFVSEWMTYQSLFLNITAASQGFKLMSLLAVAALAMAGAMAAACFVKVIGIGFLGLPRSQEAREAREVPFSMHAAMGLLTALCLILGLFPSLALNLLDGINGQILGQSILGQVRSDTFLVLYPAAARGNSLAPLALPLLGAVILVLVLAVLKWTGPFAPARRYGTWDCGFSGLNPRMQYTATGFSKPMRIILRVLYRPARELQIEEGATPYHHKSMIYVISTQSMFEKYLYVPLTRLLTRFARKTRFSIQSGSIHIYLLYMFVFIAALLAYSYIYS